MLESLNPIEQYRKILGLPKNKRGVFFGFLAYVSVVTLIIFSRHVDPLIVALIPTFFLGIAFIVFATIAGRIFFKSLFKISAGFSLITYLADAYCKSSFANPISDQALNGLVGLSSIYLIIDFTIHVIKEMDSEHIFQAKDNVGEKRSWVFLIVLAFTVGVFIYNCILVMEPIYKAICVFQR